VRARYKQNEKRQEARVLLFEATALRMLRENDIFIPATFYSIGPQCQLHCGVQEEMYNLPFASGYDL
jgi:hypothetical protein